MKKNRLKNYLKLGILLFGISIFLLNCEQDKIEMESKSKFSVKKITHNKVIENQKIASKIANYRILNEKEEAINSQARLLHSDNYNFKIDTDNVMFLENNDTGYHSYNFYLIRDNPPDDKLENLFLSLNDDGEYDTYIIKYGFSLAEYETLSEDEIALLEIQITPIDFDTTIFNNSQQKVFFTGESDGLIWGYDCDESLVNINCNLCEPWYVYTLTNCDWILLGSSSGGSGGGDYGGTGSTGNPSDPNNGAGHGGNPSNNGSSIASTPSLPNLNLDNPCFKIKNLFTNNPSLKQELINLKNLTSASTERGKYILSNSTIVQNSAVGLDGQVKLIVPPGTQKYEMIAHTHNSPANSTYSTFSYTDLEAISKLLRKGKIDNTKFVSFLSTANGTNYAFTIDDTTKFLKFFALLKDDDFDEIIAKKRIEEMNTYFDAYGLAISPPKILENSSSNLDDEKFFLDFLKNTDMGLSLFEVNDTFDSFEKVLHNDKTGDIDKTNCN